MSDSAPSSRILDHIVLLTPVGSLKNSVTTFEELGFKVVIGGTHTSGLTENALIVLSDRVYLELISFTHRPEDYPEGSESRTERENHRWARTIPGWIDYALLGYGVSNPPDGPAEPEYNLADVINSRALKAGGGALYSPSVSGGRTRPDGQELKWRITAPTLDHKPGELPFFCADVTVRSLRVPLSPLDNVEHKNDVKGVNFIRLLASTTEIQDLIRKLSFTLGRNPIESDESRAVWTLETPALPNEDVTGPASLRIPSPRLVVTTPKDESEEGYLNAHSAVIYEVSFYVGDSVKQVVNALGARIVYQPLQSQG